MKVFHGVVLLILIATTGCQTKPPKNAVSLSIHLPADRTTPRDRSIPIVIRMLHASFLLDIMSVFTERDLERVEIKGDDEDFTMRLVFDTQGTIELDALSNNHRGSLVVILFNDRVAAAPQLKQRITDGILEFTPDMTRHEAEDMMDGLNAMIQYRKKYP